MVEAGDGWTIYGHDAGTLRWSQAAHNVACKVTADPEEKANNLRHGDTWFVGVDALPNAADGAVGGVPLKGSWRAELPHVETWHSAQISVLYPGYPRQDPDESDANHRYRIKRCAAHVDGLLPIGPARRRYLREPHAFILGLPLNSCKAAPLVVWPGSQHIMGQAFRAAMDAADPGSTDITDVYQEARQTVFEQITPKPLHAEPGQAILLHRHLLHGVDAWATEDPGPPEGRMIAYFRPEFSASSWLKAN